MRRLAAPAVALALTACTGQSSFERCVDHSVEEGVDRSAAEQACEAAVGDDR